MRLFFLAEIVPTQSTVGGLLGYYPEIGTALAEKARSLVVKLKFALNLDKICIEFLF